MVSTVDSLAAAAAASPSSEIADNASAHLRVRVSDRELRLPLAALAGVADCPALAPVPAAPAWLLGVGGLHGRLLPVVDLAAAETDSVAPSAPGPHVLLVQVRGQLMGFSVSAVTVEPGDQELQGVPDFALHELAERLLATAFDSFQNEERPG